MQAAVYILFALAVLWLFMVWPGRGRKERMEVFSRQLIAHRGLHDLEKGIPENTVPAFKLAVARGYGIEFDVRECADESLVISHDDNLSRMAGIDRCISRMKRSELEGIGLFGTAEEIPDFDRVLKLVNGRVPLIIEIKSEDYKNVDRLCRNVVFWLDAYEGPACIESFNPAVVRWFKKNRPETLRGQLAERFDGPGKPSGPAAFLFSSCCFNFLTKPDFIAYNVAHRFLFRFRILRDLFHCCCAAWTVKSEETLRDAASSFDIFIFDSFEPERRKPEGALAKKERNMSRIIRKHMLVSGTVTAVGFRYRATWIAQSLGISGWVRNTWDDRVEMEIQGTPDELREMMRRLGEERFIHITDVDEKVIPALPDEYEFKVRY